MQDNVTQAEIIVARHIDAWGWGPLDQIEGLAEHKLAVDACAAGLASTRAQSEAVQKLVEALEGMLAHSCVADAALEDKLPEDYAAESAARQALAAHRESQP